MITLLLHLLRLLPFLFGGHRQLALENLALRQQLTVYKRAVPRPRLCRTDRLFWATLAKVWAGWRQPLVIVTPNTVLRWQRRRFREYWTKLSGRPPGGRPTVHAEVKALVRSMAAANPLWGAPRIHGELLKLGIVVAERTVSRLLPKRRSPPSQTWRTFLTNHVRDLVSVDFFTVPTARLRVLFVFVVLAHNRRRVVHFNVTEHPTAAWTTQQIVDAFPDDSAPSYLLREPRPRLWSAISASREGHWDRGGTDGAAKPVAESLRGTAHRLDPARMLESRARPRRATPPPHPVPVLRVRPPSPHASRARQGHPRRQAHRVPRDGKDPADARSRRSASSLRSPGGVVHHRHPRGHRARTTSPVRRPRSPSPIVILSDRARPTSANAGRSTAYLQRDSAARICGRSQVRLSESDEVLANDRLRGSHHNLRQPGRSAGRATASLDDSEESLMHTVAVRELLRKWSELREEESQ